ncbi:MAG: ATP-binding cassette domain-containing protein, partial [Acidimicrobiales bacterium]
MGHLDLNGVAYSLPDGRSLLADVSFKVDEGSVTALVGPNGAGKTTLFKMISGDVVPEAGSVSISGSVGEMRQFVGSIRDETTVRELLLEISPPALRRAATRLSQSEMSMRENPGERQQLTYAAALSDWGDLGGYDAEVLWDSCTTATLGLSMDAVGRRLVASLSGGEQKRLVLHTLLASHFDVLLLDEPDNYLDVPGKQWLEERLSGCRETILLISHDREVLRRTATRIVTLEPSAAGCTAWTHGSGYDSYHEARQDRFARLGELHKRWNEEHDHLKALVVEMRRKAAYNSDFASKLRNAEHRLRRFEEAGPPETLPRPQRISMRLSGGRTGKRALVCTGLALDGLTGPFDLELW